MDICCTWYVEMLTNITLPHKPSLICRVTSIEFKVNAEFSWIWNVLFCWYCSGEKIRAYKKCFSVSTSRCSSSPLFAHIIFNTCAIHYNISHTNPCPGRQWLSHTSVSPVWLLHKSREKPRNYRVINTWTTVLVNICAPKPWSLETKRNLFLFSRPKQFK